MCLSDAEVKEYTKNQFTNLDTAFYGMGIEKLVYRLND